MLKMVTCANMDTQTFFISAKNNLEQVKWYFLNWQFYRFLLPFWKVNSTSVFKMSGCHWMHLNQQIMNFCLFCHIKSFVLRNLMDWEKWVPSSKKSLYCFKCIPHLLWVFSAHTAVLIGMQEWCTNLEAHGEQFLPPTPLPQQLRSMMCWHQHHLLR